MFASIAVCLSDLIKELSKFVIGFLYKVSVLTAAGVLGSVVLFLVTFILIFLHCFPKYIQLDNGIISIMKWCQLVSIPVVVAWVVGILGKRYKTKIYLKNLTKQEKEFLYLSYIQAQKKSSAIQTDPMRCEIGMANELEKQGIISREFIKRVPQSCDDLKVPVRPNPSCAYNICSWVYDYLKNHPELLVS